MKGHSVLCATRGLRLRLWRKDRAGPYPGAVIFAQIILLPTVVADTLLTNFQADKKGEILSLCLTHDWLSPSIIIAPGVLVHLPFRGNDPHCRVWLTPFRASPSVMTLLNIQDPAQVSPSPSECPCPQLPPFYYYQRAS